MNQDRLRLFPNQNIEMRPTECVGETVADIAGNLAGMPMDAGFSYAATLRLQNALPTTGGSDPYTGMLSALVYGTLAAKDETFDAKAMGELYEANLDNFPPDQRHLASLFSQNGVIPLYSYGDVVKHLSRGIGGVSFAIRFFSSFTTPNQDGTLPAPIGTFSLHNCAVYEATPLGLRAKMWLGSDYGDGGYVYISEATFNLIYQSAWAFDPKSWRWLNLAYAGLTHPWALGDILPQLSKSHV